MNLYIDTTEYGKMEFILKEKGKKEIKAFFNVKPHESSQILEHLDQFLTKSKISSPKTQVSKLVILKGKGSFTGLRIAAAVGQALSLAWGVKMQVLAKTA